LLTESGDNIQGKFGKMKNPFSAVKMGVEKIKFYDKCIVTTQRESSKNIQDIKFSNAFIQSEDVSFEVTKPIVGAFDV
jgi:hypothetical protein